MAEWRGSATRIDLIAISPFEISDKVRRDQIPDELTCEALLLKWDPLL